MSNHDPNSLIAAKAFLEQRRPDRAAKLLRRFVEANPEDVEARLLLTRVQLGSHKPADALETVRSVCDRRPDLAVARYLKGVALQKLRRHAEAVRELERSLSDGRRDPDRLHALGASLFAEGKLNEASHKLQAAVHVRPTSVAHRRLLGVVLMRAKAFHAAALQFTEAYKLAPGNAGVLVDMGNAVCETGDSATAEKCYRDAIAIEPKNVAAMNNLSNLLRSGGRVEEAYAVARRACEAQPTSAICLNTCGLAASSIGRHAEAEQLYLKALANKPAYANAIYNRGNNKLEVAEFAEAEELYREALTEQPTHAETKFRLGSLLLLQGRFEEGWPLYEQRWAMKESPPKSPPIDVAEWTGQDLKGKTILLWPEQGLGDTLQFARYTAVLADRGATVCLLTQACLARLLQGVPGAAWVGGDPSRVPAKPDYQAPLLSVPAVCGADGDSVPGDVPYLRADPGLASAWASRVGSADGLRVGVAWQGKRTFLRDRQRSVPVEHVRRLAEVPGVTLFSLQKAAPQDERLGSGESLVDFSDELDQGGDAFVDTCGLIESLDLVVSSDTSVAHLAGAMGKPVWIALGRVPEWRWGLGSDQTPWYPNARLYRQGDAKSWPAVFDAMAADLALLSGKEAAASPGELLDA